MTLRTLLRSPLLHFCLIGACIFAGYALLDDTPPQPAPDAITLSPDEADRIVQQFRMTWNRSPSVAELDRLMQAWALEEALVREARALGLARGDPVIRQRLTQKMNFIAEGSAAGATADDATLQAHLEAHPDTFRRPATLAFQQIPLTPDQADQAPALLATLEDGADPAWIATCPDGLSGGTIRIEGLERTNTDTLVRYEPEPGRVLTHRLTSSDTAFTIAADAGVFEVLQSYIALGFTHILEGLDHLLFVLALLLLVPTPRALFWAVTAFTLAHSLTLAAASMGVLTVPSPPVEAVIALSIVFLAYELTLPPDRRDPLSMRAPWLVSFAFGLVHGLGFAGALREIGLPDGDAPIALFAFNLGVEAGQLAFIGIVLAAWAAIQRILPALRRHTRALTLGTSYAIGSISTFWLIDRIAAF